MSAQKPELLAPAGDFEKLQTAVVYGADAVYLSGSSYSLRAGSAYFSKPGALAEGVAYAHAHGVKVYAAVNIFAFNRDLEGLGEHISVLSDLGVDALIISDPGVFMTAREIAPDLDIHISTQANTTNWKSVRFWHELGAKRVILARETPLADIREIRERCPGDITLEGFVHGAMCVAYSGRCLLSYYMAGRSANRGECAHPCRYSYRVEEEKRPGLYLPVEEDERGVSLFSSNDLCMAGYIPAMLDAGLSSFKIEGRMKTLFYTAVTVKAYRRAIDDWFTDPACYEKHIPDYIRALRMTAHRGAPGFTTGFYFGSPGPESVFYEAEPYVRTHEFVGVVRGYDHRTSVATVEQRGKFSVGDSLEIIRAKGENFIQTVTDLRDGDGSPVSAAPHPQQTLLMKVEREVAAWDMLCRPVHTNSPA